MKLNLRDKSKRLMAMLLICFMLIGTIIPSMQIFAKSENLSLDNVNIKSFKIIDVTNGNREIDYRTNDKQDYDKLKNDPSQFSNAICQDQNNNNIKLNLSMEYTGNKAIKEGDTLTIPANYGGTLKDFALKPFLDASKNQLGTWEYKAGKFVIKFSGDYIKNHVVKSFIGSFETGEMSNYSESQPKTIKLGERISKEGQLGKHKLVVPFEKSYVKVNTINHTTSNMFKAAITSTDSYISWGLMIRSDYGWLPNQNKTYMNSYMLEHDGKYSPGALTDIYMEDTFTDCINAPKLDFGVVWVTGFDDSGKLISGMSGVVSNLSMLKKISQGSLSKEEVKKSLKKGEYCIYDNKNGSYTLMLKWWDTNSGEGLKYDDIPDVKKAGGVGSFLKQRDPDIYGDLSKETIEKINKMYRGKSVQNIDLRVTAYYVPAKEKTTVDNTAKLTSKQISKTPTAKGFLTPPAGIGSAPSDPLSVKMIKADRSTGAGLSEGFKFELQTTDDNGATWKAVDVSQDMIVKGKLNPDKTLTPDDKGIIEIKKLKAKNYRFLEKEHPDTYKDVKEDKDNPNSAKNPKSSNSRVIELNNQGSGQLIVMYNQAKPEKIDIKVNKKWIGPKKDSVKVKLMADGEDTGQELTLNKDNNWEASFKNIDKQNDNGGEIQYTIKEVEIEGYENEVTGDAKKGFTITNKNVEKISVEGTKTWDDANNQDGKRPTEITINLLSNGKKVDSKKVTEAEDWKWKFENLDKYEDGKEINYTVAEEKVEGYTTEVNGYDVKNSYTPGKTSVQVTKAWDDKNDQDKKRPNSVTIKLLADGEEIGKTLKLSKDNKWTGSFTDLDEYKEGKKIEYTIKEVEVGNGYKTVITGNVKEGFVVTNVRTPTKLKPRVPKTGVGSSSILYTTLLGLSGTVLLSRFRKKEN